jgi:membrane protein YdbS with pleckstrin-like domain
MTTDFSNSVILPESLPAIELAAFNPIDPKYLKVLYFNYLIFTLAAGLFLAVFIIMPKEPPLGIIVWCITGLLAAFVTVSLVIIKIAFPTRGYLIRERDIAYQRGLIRYKLTSIPFNRIQHVELIQSAIARRMGLATIKVYTAGSSSDDLVIPGLPLETATQVREFLTGKISPDEQD